MKKSTVVLWIMIVAYIAYFSWFTVLRYQTLYASYFDLGIMHQAVYNTYRALQTFDFSRVLEITDPLGFAQVKRMAIHNDMLLALLAPFYFINNTPSALVVLQTVILALGALATYNIANLLFKQYRRHRVLSLIFAFSYLMYVPMQQSNIFDFHAVVLATSLLLWMYYFYLTERYWWSVIFFILSILSKEQVALTTMMFGYHALWSVWITRKKDPRKLSYGYGIAAASVLWFALSIFIIIPTFRGGNHFATERFSEFGESPKEILLTVFTNPAAVIAMLSKNEIPQYINELFGSVGYLSFLSPTHLFITIPELAINSLSNNDNMRNIIFHYTAVIQPFIFISAMYGVKRLLKKHHGFLIPVCVYLLMTTSWFAYTMGPLPFQRRANIHPIKYPQEERHEIMRWAKLLEDESIKVSTTGHYAPFFTNRRYFYNFSTHYGLADYILVSSGELRDPHSYSDLKDEYQSLASDPRYELIFKSNKLEVFRRRNAV